MEDQIKNLVYSFTILTARVTGAAIKDAKINSTLKALLIEFIAKRRKEAIAS